MLRSLVDGCSRRARKERAGALIAALVTTAAGGIGTVVSDGQTALVVPERDAGRLASAIARVLDDPDFGQSLGAAARQLAASRFGWSRTAERFEAAYDRALAFKSNRR